MTQVMPEYDGGLAEAWDRSATPDIVRAILRRHYARVERLLAGYIAWIVLAAGPDCPLLRRDEMQVRLGHWIRTASGIRRPL
jgi:hypothetical protein